jgi:hypothetical protein
VDSTDARDHGGLYAGLITRWEWMMDEETAAPADELEAVEFEDDLGDGAYSHVANCDKTGAGSLNNC